MLSGLLSTLSFLSGFSQLLSPLLAPVPAPSQLAQLQPAPPISSAARYLRVPIGCAGGDPFIDGDITLEAADPSIGVQQYYKLFPQDLDYLAANGPGYSLWRVELISEVPPGTPSGSVLPVIRSVEISVPHDCSLPYPKQVFLRFSGNQPYYVGLRRSWSTDQSLPLHPPFKVPPESGVDGVGPFPAYYPFENLYSSVSSAHGQLTCVGQFSPYYLPPGSNIASPVQPTGSGAQHYLERAKGIWSPILHYANSVDTLGALGAYCDADWDLAPNNGQYLPEAVSWLGYFSLTGSPHQPRLSVTKIYHDTNNICRAGLDREYGNFFTAQCSNGHCNYIPHSVPYIVTIAPLPGDCPGTATLAKHTPFGLTFSYGEVHTYGSFCNFREIVTSVCG